MDSKDFDFAGHLLLSLLIPAAQSLLAQSARYVRAYGTVKDPSGAVDSERDRHRYERRYRSQAHCHYRRRWRLSVHAVASGRLRSQIRGFRIQNRRSSIDHTERHRDPRLDRTLEVGQQGETVTVTAEAPVLQTQIPRWARPSSRKQSSHCLEQPQLHADSELVGRRERRREQRHRIRQGHAWISASTAPTRRTITIRWTASPSSTPPTRAASNDCGIYAGIGIPNPDAIQEFKIQTSTYDASYGRNPGANVNVVTDPARNEFHGSLLEFFRNEDLNANSFFDNRDGGGKQQVLKQNQFGGAIGGPIKKDKLFFFGSYQENTPDQWLWRLGAT